MTDETTTENSQRISRTDIENKLRSIQELIQGRLKDEKQTLVGAAVGAGFIAVLVAYFAGRRRGRKKSAFVEIRRG